MYANFLCSWSNYVRQLHYQNVLFGQAKSSKRSFLTKLESSKSKYCELFIYWEVQCLPNTSPKQSLFHNHNKHSFFPSSLRTPTLLMFENSVSMTNATQTEALKNATRLCHQAFVFNWSNRERSHSAFPPFGCFHLCLLETNRPRG